MLAGELPDDVREPLTRVQNELFDVGADLPCRGASPTGCASTRSSIDRLEELCDRFNADLPELRSFVLPGGTEAAARLHVARTLCRRAEREVAARVAGVDSTRSSSPT